MGFECSNYFIFWDVKIWIKEREFLLAATGIYQFKQFHFIKNFSSKNIYQEAEFKITNKFKTI